MHCTRSYFKVNLRRWCVLDIRLKQAFHNITIPTGIHRLSCPLAVYKHRFLRIRCRLPRALGADIRISDCKPTMVIVTTTILGIDEEAPVIPCIPTK